jgi:hypothetical protein
VVDKLTPTALGLQLQVLSQASQASPSTATSASSKVEVRLVLAALLPVKKLGNTKGKTQSHLGLCPAAP